MTFSLAYAAFLRAAESRLSQRILEREHYHSKWYQQLTTATYRRRVTRLSATRRARAALYSTAPGPPTGRLRPVRFSRSRMSEGDRTQQSPLASDRAKAQAEAEGKKAPSRFANMFPLGYKETFSQWWANVPAATAEHNVLSHIPYLQSAPTQAQTGSKVVKESSDSTPASEAPSTDDLTKSPSQSAPSQNDPYGPRMWHSNLVKLSGRHRALNEFSVERVGEEVENNIVIVHGYGAGLGFFYKNFEALSRQSGWKLYALDLLGMGRSTRPPFKINADPKKDREGSIREAEDWFVDSLEEWRRARKLEKFTLLGHSLGGYMAVAYALKYPGRLNKLILASPVGIPEDPYAVSAEMPEPESSTLHGEVTQDQDESTSSGPKTRTQGDQNNFMNARSGAAKDKNAKEPSPGQPPRRTMPKWFQYLWDANISPFSLVRWSGPLGPRFVSGWTSRRFNHLPPEEAEALHTYAYTLFKQRGSGEYALAYILAPGAFARSPLIRRIGGVGRQTIPPLGEHLDTGAGKEQVEQASKAQGKKEDGLPVVLMYGENDWMDVAGGYAAVEKLKEEQQKALATATSEEKERENGESKVLVVKKAGHHVYLDGWEEFNELILKEMKDVETRERRREDKGWS